MVDAHDGETYTAKGSRLIWIDCEMTGLDIFHDELCEISVVPTDFDLNVLDEGIDFVIKPSDAAVANMNDFVRAMHTRSGLINEWENGLSVEEAERKVTEYVARFTPDGVKPLLAGNSIGSDKKFLDRYMPNLMEHLHYRVIDVSVQRACPPLVSCRIQQPSAEERRTSRARRHHRIPGRTALLP